MQYCRILVLQIWQHDKTAAPVRMRRKVSVIQLWVLTLLTEHPSKIRKTLQLSQTGCNFHHFHKGLELGHIQQTLHKTKNNEVKVDLLIRTLFSNVYLNFHPHLPISVPVLVHCSPSNPVEQLQVSLDTQAPFSQGGSQTTTCKG